MKSSPLVSTRFVFLLCLLATPIAAWSQDEAAPVEVVTPADTTLTNTLRLTGNLVSAQRASLSSRVDGLISTVAVDAGDRVKAGEVLLTLDDAVEKYELERLKATTEAANAQAREALRLVNEADRLAKNNHIAQNELALRRAAMENANALLAAARAEQLAQQQRVDWHSLKAPFDGVVHSKLTESGEWVTRGTPVLELVATDRLYLDVQVPQERYSELTKDTEVTVMPDSLPGTQLTARLTALVPVGEAGSRTFRARLVLDQEENEGLLPGFSAVALFNLADTNKRALMIPRDALLRNPDGSFSLYIIESGEGKPVAQRRQVKLGFQSGTRVEVIDGLKAGEQVVVRGNEILRHGQTVRIVKSGQ